MLFEQGLEHRLAGVIISRQMNPSLADLAHLNPGSGCGSGGTRRHLFLTATAPRHCRGRGFVSETTCLMPIEPLLIVELAVLGLGTGFLAGLLGIGGGMLMVPFITYHPGRTAACRRTWR